MPGPVSIAEAGAPLSAKTDAASAETKKAVLKARIKKIPRLNTPFGLGKIDETEKRP